MESYNVKQQQSPWNQTSGIVGNSANLVQDEVRRAAPYQSLDNVQPALPLLQTLFAAHDQILNARLRLHEFSSRLQSQPVKLDTDKNEPPSGLMNLARDIVAEGNRLNLLISDLTEFIGL